MQNAQKANRPTWEQVNNVSPLIPALLNKSRDVSYDKSRWTLRICPRKKFRRLLFPVDAQGQWPYKGLINNGLSPPDTGECTMNAQDTARTMWAWKQVKAAEKAEASAKSAWMANSTTANWMAWDAAQDRTEAARRAADVAVKQVVMQNDAARVW
jgi:hypothetical protein